MTSRFTRRVPTNYNESLDHVDQSESFLKSRLNRNVRKGRPIRILLKSSPMRTLRARNPFLSRSCLRLLENCKDCNATLLQINLFP